MRHISILFFAFFCFGSLIAQPTVSNSIFPVEGSVLVSTAVLLPSGVTVTPAGPDQVWDYSSLPITLLDSTSYYNADTGIASASFPTADLVTLTAGTENYFQSNSGSFSLLGFTGADPLGLGIDINFPFNPPQRLFTAPMTYTDIANHSSGFAIGISPSLIPGGLLDSLPVDIDSIRIIRTSSTQEEADAYGTMMLPNGTYNDVLRVKQEILGNTSLELRVEIIPGFPLWVNPSSIPGFPTIPFLGDDLTTTYQYFKDGVQGPVLTMNLDSVGGVRSVSFIPSDFTDGIISPKEIESLSLFPNPVTNQCWVQLPNTSGNQVLSIYDLTGKTVANLSLTGANQGMKIKIDTAHLPKGTYSILLRNEEGILEGKGRFIKQ